MGIACLPLGLWLAPPCFAGLMLGATLSLGNFLLLGTLVRHRLIPARAGHGGLTLGLLLAAKSFVLVAVLTGTLILRLVDPLWLLGGISLMVGAVMLRAGWLLVGEAT